MMIIINSSELYCPLHHQSCSIEMRANIKCFTYSKISTDNDHQQFIAI